MNRRRVSGLFKRVLTTAAGVLFVSAFGGPDTGAQVVPLRDCDGLLFSVEEDFTSRGPEPPGGPVVSDGDLLSYDFFGGGGTRICARNRELLQRFGIGEDLGLDAVVLLDPTPLDLEFPVPRIAFSTSLDDPGARFTAGDLLTTDGIIIPNSALLARFVVNQIVPPRLNLGLDALEFVGDPDAINLFLDAVADGSVPVDNLAEALLEAGIDIWFSVEGTAPSPQVPGFLDGDMLSAASGTIVDPGTALLPLLPAGIPVRGVDYGVDAYTRFDGPTRPGDEANLRARTLFSTEIPSIDRPVAFSAGDVLARGPVLVRKNFDLILPLEPVVREIGLDALDLPSGEPPCEEDIELRVIGGVDVLEIHPLSGLAEKRDGANPLLPPMWANPFGQMVSLRGFLPDTECVDCEEFEYRVEFQELPNPAWNGIPTPGGWMARRGFGCPDQLFSDTGDGWIPLCDYWDIRDFCNPDHPLNVWNTSGRNGLYNVRLTLRKNGDASSEVHSTEVLVMLDNRAPSPVKLTLFDSDGNEIEDQCDPEDPILSIRGQARDDLPTVANNHFRVYQLSWTGGDSGMLDPIDLGPGEQPDHRFYDNQFNPFLGLDGTLPPGDMSVALGTFDLVAEHIAKTGNPPPEKCGYCVRLRVIDRTIRGAFNPGLDWLSDGHRLGWLTDLYRCFCFESDATRLARLEPLLDVFRRGEIDGNSTIDIADGLFVLNYLFSDGRLPECLKSADVNDNGRVELADPLYLLNALFLGGPEPPEPYRDCDVDPTEDELTCVSAAACL